MAKPYNQYTKEQIVGVIQMWESHKIAEIASALSLPIGRVSHLAKIIRQVGYALPKKFTIPKNNLKNILEEILAERGGKNG